MTKLEQANEFFKNDLYASKATGIEIVAVEEGYAKCMLKLEDIHRNAVGQVMGGVFFTMADYAFAIAANFNQPTTVTQTSQIMFLSVAKGNTLYAETECIRKGRKSCFYKIMITDELGTEIAYVTTTGAIIGQ